MTLPQVDGAQLSPNSSDSDTPPSPPLVPTKARDFIRVASVNAQSISGKFEDIANLFNTGLCDIVAISETWRTDSHTKDIEKLEELHGLQWVDTPRASGTGGGVAVITSRMFGKSHKLTGLPPPPKNVETTWTVLTPFARPETRVIVCSFYSSTNPDYKPEKDYLQEYIIQVANICRNRYSSVNYVIAGDINQDNLEQLRSLDMEERVQLPTGTLKSIWTAKFSTGDFIGLSDSWNKDPSITRKYLALILAFMAQKKPLKILEFIKDGIFSILLHSLELIKDGIRF